MGVCVGKLGANATGPRLLSLSCLLEAPGRDFFPAHCDTMFAPNAGCLAWQVTKAESQSWPGGAQSLYAAESVTTTPPTPWGARAYARACTHRHIRTGTYRCHV